MIDQFNRGLDVFFNYIKPYPDWVKSLFCLFVLALVFMLIRYMNASARLNEALAKFEGKQLKRDVLITPIGIVTYEHAADITTSSIDEKILKLIKGHPGVDLEKYEDHLQATIISVDRKNDGRRDDIMPVGRPRR